MSNRTIMENLQLKKVYHFLSAEKPFEVSCGFSPGARETYSGDSHYDLQICVVLSGQMEVRYNDFRTFVSAGQFWLTSCWEPHFSRPSKKRMSYLVITISPEFLGQPDMFHEINWLAPFFVLPRERPQSEAMAERLAVHRLGREIKKLWKAKPHGWKNLVWLKLHELMICVLSNWENEQHSSVSGAFMRILPAVRYVRDNPDKSLSVEEAAKLCGMSRSGFSNLFTATLGKSFAKFALNARISEAAKKLDATIMPIKDIASECGFADLGHFYHVFEKHFKCTPLDYRKRKFQMLH